MADTIVWGIYRADDGTLYRVRRRSWMFDYSSTYGWFETTDLTMPLLPHWLKMRYVIAYGPDRHHVLNVARDSVYAWTIRDGTLNVVVAKADGTRSSGYLVQSWFDERVLKHS